MSWSVWHLLALAALLAILGFSILSRIIGQLYRNWVARRRAARASRGERRAERFLEASGYRVLDKQVPACVSLQVDGELVEFAIRADLIVERDAIRYVAEVKTGDAAPRLSNVATRRQLLEYSVAFASPTILLVDVERNQIREISFLAPTDE